jgi:hypothetical protein
VKYFLLAFVLLTASARAQEVEQVTVYGGNLSGFWHIDAAIVLGVGTFGKVTWGPFRQVWCRFDHGADGYSDHCFGGTSKGGALDADARHFHMTAGTAMMRLIYDGEVTSATSIEGHYSIKLIGVSVTNPELAHGTKALPRPDAPDEAGKAQLVRSALAGEAIPHNAALDADIGAARGLNLGAIQHISFLGYQKMAGKDAANTADPNYLAAYAVEFARGQALCWLHQDEDGKLAAFRCA